MFFSCSQLFNCFGELSSIGDSCSANSEVSGEEIEIGESGITLSGVGVGIGSDRSFRLGVLVRLTESCLVKGGSTLEDGVGRMCVGTGVAQRVLSFVDDDDVEIIGNTI